MEPNIVFSQLTGGAACAYLLLLLQKWSKLPWITAHTTWINFLVRVVFSLATTLGIQAVWNANLSVPGGHVLMVTVPPAAAILHAAWVWFGQYAMQHGWLNLFTMKPVTPPLVSESKAK
jgi:hypothetical protein